MSLSKLRKEIDRIDYSILKLLNKRMEHVLRLKKLKLSVSDENRELEVFNHIQKCSQNLIQSEFSVKLFKEIIEESKRLQNRKIKVVGFQGEHGAFSSAAATAFDPALVPIPCMDFAEIFHSVKNNQLDTGIIPVENSLEGAVAQANDLLIESNLYIIGEIVLPIHHCLLALRDTDHRDIRTVYSHPQALAQCHGFIARNKLEPRPFYDTAGAAKMLAETRLKGSAAIASKLCAELYNLDVIKENIEDHESNSTRFVILSAEPADVSGNKCSIAFSTRHEAGALYKILKLFSDARINLTRIESRPVKKEPGKYAFLLDFQGSDSESNVKTVLDSVCKESAMFKFFGCYMEHIR